MIGEGPVGVNLLTWLGGQSFILLFLVVAAGYALGRVKIKGIGLGTTASSLVIALGVSLWGASVGAKIARARRSRARSSSTSSCSPSA